MGKKRRRNTVDMGEKGRRVEEEGSQGRKWGEGGKRQAGGNGEEGEEEIRSLVHSTLCRSRQRAQVQWPLPDPERNTCHKCTTTNVS